MTENRDGSIERQDGREATQCPTETGDAFGWDEGNFPDPIRKLPLADIPLEGVRAYLSQSDSHQIIFMYFEKDVVLPEHAHAEQIGFVLDGKIELTIDHEKRLYTRGDRYYIPKGVLHSGRIFAGYSDITFFNESDRYRVKVESPAEDPGEPGLERRDSER